MQDMQNYLPLLLFVLVGGAIGLGLPLLGKLLAPNRPDAQKLSPYECGFEAFGDARMQFDVRYYLIAILFILFDLEAAFLIPWAVVFKEMGWAAFAAIALFVLEFVIAYVFLWKKGALEWE
mgnify:CR=1 FL=1